MHTHNVIYKDTHTKPHKNTQTQIITSTQKQENVQKMTNTDINRLNKIHEDTR